RARAISGRSSPSRRGGSRTTACSARFTPAKASGRGPSGPSSCRTESPRQSIARGASSPRTFSSISTCNGSPPRSGARPGVRRARRSADLFDGYRVDHLVGFYRTYGKPKSGGPASFSPPDEPSQLALGERVLGVFSANAEIVAEDLGTVPDFVRASLARLAIPG